ncbi:hypothetical protein Ciccas_005337 [Cichlidogyrus casuarinus]|uniref:Adenosine 3'-phospho 5'-phosphosulfate transporter 1 n=1 Tax=Cichlidogyrus casuarinus TaxID=1844966 RepID=A0ABD2Q967_9PLAT
MSKERMMTTTYGSGEQFKDSQLLVFVNRLLAFCLVAILHLTGLTPTSLYYKNDMEGQSASVPFYSFSYASLSNIISSWCQYEALKFVDFPTQVLSKACKVIPVMLFGRLVQNKHYSRYEYFNAAMISSGMALFLFFNNEHVALQANFNIAGAFFLFSYMLSDAFTANWQDALFARFQPSTFQMLLGINFWSMALTLVPLLEQGSLLRALEFASRNPQFGFHVLMSSICGAVGQLFIYHTINKYGAVTFTIIMTVRQALAVLFSCIIFKHSLHPPALIGLCILFMALFLRVRSRLKPKAAEVSNKSLA